MLSFIGIPTPPSLQPQSRVHDLKARLDWGEPALTIIDVRDRKAFNQEHIRGAIPMPAGSLLNHVEANLEKERDIYIYGETDDETAMSAASLRNAGYFSVAELRGGLSAWKAVGYPTEVSAIA